MRRVLFASLLFSATAAAQVSLEGDVVRKSTGEPIAGVRVTAPCGRQVQGTATDANGHFQCAIPPDFVGNLVLSFDGPGLLPRKQRITVKTGDSLISVRVPMTPQAALVGKVLDENGWPVRANVTAAQYVTENGERRLEPARLVRTDDLGQYRIGKLPPGRYYLRIRPLGGNPWNDYLPVWYPSAAAETSAQAIDLQEGQEASGMDIHVSREGGVELRGRVVMPTGFQPAQGALKVAWEELGSTVIPGEIVPLAADGTFTLRHVTPGKYRFTATPRGNFEDESNPPKYSATRTIEVSRDNIDGITMSVDRTVVRDLKGTVICDGGLKPDQVHIAFQRSPGHSPVQLTAKVEADGSFVIPGVWPGRYFANAWAENVPASSVQFGAQEIMRRQFDFDGTDAALRVTVRGEGKPVPVAGTVTDANNHPVSGASVIILPSASSSFVTRLPADTDQNGAFTARPLPVGVYRMYVVEDPTEVDKAMSDPDFVKSQEKAFAPLIVVEGESAQSQLSLAFPLVQMPSGSHVGQDGILRPIGNRPVRVFIPCGGPSLCGRANFKGFRLSNIEVACCRIDNL